jgi:hypothetical protein
MDELGRTARRTGAAGHGDREVPPGRQAPAHPRRHDRARQQAFDRLLQAYAARGDLDAIESIHRQRRADYPGISCQDLAHARFLVTLRGDAAAAEAILDTLPQKTCEQGPGRMLLALVRYVGWTTAKEPRRAEALRMARVVAPVSPQLLYTLAETDHTAVAIKQVVAAGEKFGMQDNQRMDALAYALANRDHAAAGRLIAIRCRHRCIGGRRADAGGAAAGAGRRPGRHCADAARGRR